MPRPTLTVESFGSYWMIDETDMMYCRTPKSEGPRSSPPGQDWGGPGADPGLQDLVWHDYIRWWVQDRWRVELIIERSDTSLVSAPISDAEYERLAGHAPGRREFGLTRDQFVELLDRLDPPGSESQA